tara:strand:+ start:827 stop:1660 length:834 start_codon:yes stop_codon:yes gene_type:complete
MAEKKNQAQLRLEAHQRKMVQFEEDIKNLGNPNDYTNKANYTGKVNELRKKYGVAGIGKDLNTYRTKLKREEGKLKKVVTSRYIKRAPVGLLERLVIDDYDNIGTRYSDKNSLGYKINPDYVESLDPAGETQLKKDAAEKLKIQNQNAALEAGAVEREENEWGPGGQPTSANQYAAAGIDLNNLNVGNVLGNSKVTIEGNNNNTEGTTYEHPLSDPDYNPEATKANQNKAKLALGGQSMRTLEERTKAIERAYGPMSKEAKRKLRLRPITQLELEAM